MLLVSVTVETDTFDPLEHIKICPNSDLLVRVSLQSIPVGLVTLSGECRKTEHNDK